MTYSRTAAVLCFIVVMLITALTPIGLSSPTRIEAGHDDPTTSHLSNVDDYPIAGGRIVRNVILGEAIPVCSDDLRLSTQAAAAEWNEFFGWEDGDARDEAVFLLKDDGSVFASTEQQCKRMQSGQRGIDSVHVERNLAKCDPLANGCITRIDSLPDEDYDTYTGQHVIHVRDYRVPGQTARVILADNEDRVTRTIMHELGHVFGLGNYATADCVRSPTSVDQTNKRTIMSPATAPGARPSRCASDIPTEEQDQLDFRRSYVPEAPQLPDDPDDAANSPSAYTVTLRWNAENVHVESDFGIQRWDELTRRWFTIRSHEALPFGAEDPNPTLIGQPINSQTYRIVARTRAPLQLGTIAASDEIEVVVLGPPPNAPTELTATAFVEGINLTWKLATDIPRIDGYEFILNRDSGGEWQPMPDRDHTAISHSVRPLVSGTEYVVEIRAVRARASSGPSNRATATPKVRPVQPPIPEPLPKPSRPADMFWDTEVTLSTWISSVTHDDGVICYIERTQYEQYQIESWIKTHTCVGNRWVSHTSLFLTSDPLIRSTALPTTPCGSLSDQIRERATAASTGTFLLEGTYVFRWGDQRVQFTLPEGSFVDLSWRVLDSGVNAAVLTDGGAGEVLVYPGASATSSAGDDSDGDPRSTVLQAVAASIQGFATQSATATEREMSTCLIVSDQESRATIDLDVNRCATVAEGGEVQIVAGGHTLALTLISGRDWVVLRLRTDAADGTRPIVVLDATTRSSLLLDPATGAELERTIPDDAPTEIGSLLDAIAASVQHSDATDDSS